jgi:hypothetical protein
MKGSPYPEMIYKSKGYGPFKKHIPADNPECSSGYFRTPLQKQLNKIEIVSKRPAMVPSS